MSGPRQCFFFKCGPSKDAKSLDTPAFSRNFSFDKQTCIVCYIGAHSWKCSLAPPYDIHFFLYFWTKTSESQNLIYSSFWKYKLFDTILNFLHLFILNPNTKREKKSCLIIIFFHIFDIFKHDKQKKIQMHSKSSCLPCVPSNK